MTVPDLMEKLLEYKALGLTMTQAYKLSQIILIDLGLEESKDDAEFRRERLLNLRADIVICAVDDWKKETGIACITSRSFFNASIQVRFYTHDHVITIPLSRPIFYKEVREILDKVYKEDLGMKDCK